MLRGSPEGEREREREREIKREGRRERERGGERERGREREREREEWRACLLAGHSPRELCLCDNPELFNVTTLTSSPETLNRNPPT